MHPPGTTSAASGARQASGETYEKHDPVAPLRGDRRLPGIGRGRRPRRRRRCRRGGFPAWAALPAPARAALFHKAADAIDARVGADRPGHDRRDGQAAARGAHGGGAGGDDPPLRRRRGVAAGRRGLRRVRPAPAALHGAAPARRRRPDHAVELPDRDPGLEARARADLRQHGRAEARPRRAADGAPRRRVLRRGGAPARRAQRAHRLRLDGRRGARREPRRPRDLVHRLGRGRARRARRGDRARLPRPARARRPEPASS